MNAIMTGTVPLAFSAGPWEEADRALLLREAPGPAVEVPIATRRKRGFSPLMQDPRASVGQTAAAG